MSSAVLFAPRDKNSAEDTDADANKNKKRSREDDDESDQPNRKRVNTFKPEWVPKDATEEETLIKELEAEKKERNSVYTVIRDALKETGETWCDIECTNISREELTVCVNDEFFVYTKKFASVCTVDDFDFMPNIVLVSRNPVLDAQGKPSQKVIDLGHFD